MFNTEYKLLLLKLLHAPLEHYSIEFLPSLFFSPKNMVVSSNFAPPTVGIRHQQPLTMAIMNNKEMGKGTLFITESNVSWVDSSGFGFSLEYPHICAHGISRDLESFPDECLLMTFDDSKANLTDDVESDDSEDFDDEEGEFGEMLFIPDDKNMLSVIYRAICECQALHADPTSSDDEIFEDADEDEEYHDDETEEGEYHLANAELPISLGSIGEGRQITQNGNCHDEAMEMDDGQFEDADDVNN